MIPTRQRRRPKRQVKLNPITKAPSRLPKQPFLAHLDELRSRLFLSTLVLVVGSVVGYFQEEQILKLLLSPLNEPLYYTSPAGGFSFTLELSIFFGLVVALPVFIFQILRFIEPAMPPKTRFSVLFLLLAASFLMIFGMAFAYFVSLPAALHFLAEFSRSDVKSLISTTEYFSFVTRYLLGFGLLFQLPLFMVFINRIVPLRLTVLLKIERWVILIAFIAAGILTPTPDFVNQTIMALPIILLYQISILIVWLMNRPKKARVFSLLRL